jgi:hypothetical protein
MKQLLADLEAIPAEHRDTRRMTLKGNSVDSSGIVPAEGQLYGGPVCCRFRITRRD